MMTCPGCSRHCCVDALRCKYGCAYFAKMQESKQLPPQKYKWEKHFVQGGVIWQILMVNRRMKKAVCKGKVTEDALLARLTQPEQQLICSQLTKLEGALPAEK